MTDNTMTNRKRTNDIDLQNTSHKTTDRVTGIPQNTGVNSCAPEVHAVPVPHISFTQCFCTHFPVVVLL